MRKYLLCLGVAMGLGAALLCVESRAADPTVVKDLDAVSKDATTKKWEDVVKETKGMSKHDIEAVMHVMSRRNPKDAKNSGIGIGAKPGAIEPDGIDAKLLNMTKNGIPPGELAANQADFKKMVDQMAAIAGVANNATPPRKAADANGAIWKQTSAEMFEKAQNLNKAIDGKNNAQIKTASTALYDTCKKCHNVYK